MIQRLSSDLSSHFRRQWEKIQRGAALESLDYHVCLAEPYVLDKSRCWDVVCGQSQKMSTSKGSIARKRGGRFSRDWENQEVMRIGVVWENLESEGNSKSRKNERTENWEVIIEIQVVNGRDGERIASDRRIERVSGKVMREWRMEMI